MEPEAAVKGRLSLMPNMTAISITPWQMQPGEDKIVAERIYGVLSKKRDPKPTEIKPPAADLSGRWDVSVEFFSSKSEHALFIEQKGNRIQGTHKGDFSVRELFGTIEGDQITLRSTSAERGTGDSVSFTFSGTVAADSISGPIHMGEYLTAKFTARRHPYPASRGPIFVPRGRRWRIRRKLSEELFHNPQVVIYFRVQKQAKIRLAGAGLAIVLLTSAYHRTQSAPVMA